MRYEQRMNQQQKQVQKLAMTQRLQQSIQVLQYNAEELVTFLETKALENPLMEVSVVHDELPVFAPSTGINYDQDGANEEKNMMNQVPDNQTSLFEFLLDQIHLNYRDTYLRQLILYLVEYIDSNGYLKISLEEAQKNTGATGIQMLDALVLLQQLDPAGVGARNLQECLMLQTERDNEAPPLAYLILEESFESLVNRKWDKISKAYDISLPEVQQVFDYIQQLSPRPGAGYGRDTEEYIIPDIIVENDQGKLRVSATKSGKPQIHFQQSYFDRLSKIEDQEVQTYLKNRKAEFDWIEKSLSQRGDTILRIASAIAEYQSSFFLDSDHSLKPLLIKDIAETLDLHESTVSRGVNGKYLQTNFGTFPLRMFFSTGIATTSDDGSEKADVSVETVKQKIADLIDCEDKRKPLSDQKLADLLTQDHYEISRRTVAKYRDALGILSSSKRKRFD